MSRRETDSWIVVEHTPVITLGRQAKRENVLLSEGALAPAGSTWSKSSAAATSPTTARASSSFIPSRLERFREVVPLVRSLESAIINVCARYGIASERWSEHPRRLGRAQPNLRDRTCGAAGWFHCTALRSTSRPGSITIA